MAVLDMFNITIYVTRYPDRPADIDIRGDIPFATSNF